MLPNDARHLQLLARCEFTFLSHGRFGYTDFGFINDKDKEIKKFLIKISPLDQEKEIGSYAYVKGVPCKIEKIPGLHLSHKVGEDIHTFFVLNKDILPGPDTVITYNGKKEGGQKFLQIDDDKQSIVGPF